MKQKKETDFQRTKPDLNQGLSKKQVEERILANQTNEVKDKVSKSYGKILFENFFNIFDLVLYAIALVFLFFVIYLNATGHKDVSDHYFGFSKFTFLIPVLLNALIGSIQEIHSKNVIRRLKIVHEAKSIVIRDGKEVAIPVHDLVLDDVVKLKSGDQISADMILKEGYLEVDESLLTGEADLVKKKPGDFLYSGSSIMVGSGKGVVEKVGNNTYAASLTNQVRALSRHKSELMSNIYGLIKILSVVLLVVVIVVVSTLTIKIHFYGDDPSVWGNESENITYNLATASTWARIFLTAGAFAIGVIPTGLVLLTSITLAVSITRLARQRTMIQELYSLENLSRVDTICLDKTGTLTDGSMKVIEEKYLIPEKEAISYIRQLLGASDDLNATTLALKERFGSEKVSFRKYLPFSSATKSSGLIYDDERRLTLGAPDYLLDKNSDLYFFMEEKSKEGKRVLALLLNELPIALFVLEDNIRKSAKETIAFFYENHVDVKIISGDNVYTVSKIASLCGVKEGKAISMENVPLEKIPSLVEDYTIFARVSPEQKQKIVESLQEKKRKVAMTGDGVNDILALRRANASITFAKATDAAKACSDVVLLDNDFSHLKEVVSQGRRVVNNIERTAILFLMKTSSIALLSIVLIPLRRGQMWFSVENIYLMQTSVIAIGGFLLSMEGTKEPIRGTFKENVLPKALASGILIVVAVLVPILLNQVPTWFHNKPLIKEENVGSLISILTSLAGLVVTISMCLPINRYRRIVILVVILAGILLGMAFPTSCIGGRTSTFSMFQSDDGNIFHSQFFHEFFQPWNSPVIHSINSEPATFITMGIFFLVALPVYILIMRNITKKQDMKKDS